MNFMLLGGRHNKVLATDQTGRAVLYDPDRHAVHTLRAFTEPKQMPVSFTIGGDHLYVLDVSPAPGCNDTCFECLEYYPHGGDEDWYLYVLPPPPPLETDESDDLESSPCVDSCAVSGDGSRIWITDQHLGTYSFDTTVEVWSKVGNWALPFDGVTEYVPELGLWFGLKNEDRCVLCAVDLMTTSVPAVRSFWVDLTPPAEWPGPDPTSRLVHLGAARFCIARFFTDDSFAASCHFPVTHAVFTAVEVEHCADAEGGLRMVKHRSKLFTLLHNMSYWVL
jgi:hypothetical protein